MASTRRMHILGSLAAVLTLALGVFSLPAVATAYSQPTFEFAYMDQATDAQTQFVRDFSDELAALPSAQAHVIEETIYPRRSDPTLHRVKDQVANLESSASFKRRVSPRPRE